MAADIVATAGGAVLLARRRPSSRKSSTRRVHPRYANAALNLLEVPQAHARALDRP
jgi:hypothetical protein